ncbi:hypothetical protein QBC37DRAFT_388695 [Rhypophila decipiens]|uniref:Uncharacterized protein n=1 Tax=Rhypophila decipiens TaxID=261697 RepID=A0AAN6Y4X2_9PEZI|nr:hypothetical protein QBC37DRAFT_388695 [Rhypophila decipiens]
MHGNYILLVLCSCAAAAAATCYNLNGDEVSNTNIIPCDADEPITHCCSSDDLCARNGLCLNNGDDGKISAQGCTDPGWNLPCHQQLRSDNCQDSGDYVPLWMCKSVDRAIMVCCDPDTSQCCVDALANEQGRPRLYEIPKWGQVWPPGQKSLAVPSNPITVVTTSSSTAGPTSSKTTETTSASNAGPTSSISGGATPGPVGHGSIDPLPVALAVVFGILFLALGFFQLRYVARESKRRGKPAGFGGAVGSTVPAMVPRWHCQGVWRCSISRGSGGVGAQ